MENIDQYQESGRTPQSRPRDPAELTPQHTDSERVLRTSECYEDYETIENR